MPSDFMYLHNQKSVTWQKIIVYRFLIWKWNKWNELIEEYILSYIESCINFLFFFSSLKDIFNSTVKKSHINDLKWWKAVRVKWCNNIWKIASELLRISESSFKTMVGQFFSNSAPYRFFSLSEECANFFERRNMKTCNLL